MWIRSTLPTTTQVVSNMRNKRWSQGVNGPIAPTPYNLQALNTNGYDGGYQTRGRPPPLSKTKGELKAFIGLVKYFRDHLKDLSIVLRPLDKLVTPYHPKDILIWDVPCTEAFEIAKN